MNTAYAGWLARMRYRVGARLIRPHVTALLEHYNALSKTTRGDRAERCDYIGIGLRHALGIGIGWRKPVPAVASKKETP